MENKYSAIIDSISNCICCENCASHLYEKQLDKPITIGYGNRYTDTMIIVPGYNYNKEDEYNPISKLEELYKNITNENLYEKCYVTRQIKCIPHRDYSVNLSSIEPCAGLIYWEIAHIKPSKIIVIGCDNTYDTIQNYNVCRNVKIINTVHWLSDKFNSEFTIAINS